MARQVSKLERPICSVQDILVSPLVTGCGPLKQGLDPLREDSMERTGAS